MKIDLEHDPKNLGHKDLAYCPIGQPEIYALCHRKVQALFGPLGDKITLQIEKIHLMGPLKYGATRHGLLVSRTELLWSLATLRS